MHFPNLLLGIGAVLPAIFTAVEAQHAWHMDVAKILVNEQIDPVVTPNSQSTHMHKVIGGSRFGASYNFDDYANAACSSLAFQADKSNYWMPSLYWFDKAIKKYIPIQATARFYYFFATNTVYEPISPFPEGLRILAGDPTAKSPNIAANFLCMTNFTSTYGWQQSNDFNFNRDCPYGMKTEVYFPPCWDGLNLYLADDAHMAYPTSGSVRTGACPLSHPVRIPSIQLEYTWLTSNYAPGEALAGNLLWANGDTTGYGIHADFVNGWDSAVLAAALNSSACGMGPDTTDAINMADCPIIAATADTALTKSCKPELGVLTEAGNADLVPLSALPGCNLPWTSGPKPTCSPAVAGLDISSLTGRDGSYVTDKPRNLVLPTEPGWHDLVCMSSAASLLGRTDFVDSGLTQSSCQQSCAKAGFSYAGVGLQGDKTVFHCICGTGLDYTQAVQPGMCNIPCPGNSTQTCGNSYIYQIFYAPPGTVTPDGVVQLANGIASLGCYNGGSASSNLLGSSTYTFSSSSMTVETCTLACSEIANSTWAGLTGAMNCYCGNKMALGTGSYIPSSYCNTPCIGNKTEICGSTNNVVSLYNVTAASYAANLEYRPAGYKGCYAQGTNKLGLTSTSLLGNFMTSDVCVNSCSELGYKYAGLQNGVNCYCGNNVTLSVPQPSSQCNIACPANATIDCGGRYNIDVYETSLAPVTTATTAASRPAGFVGCFLDSGTSVSLTNYSYTSTVMTVDLCKSACSNFNYAYSGLKAGKTCKCGSAPVTPQVAAAVYCTTKCPGNSTQTCGASNYLEAYSTAASVSIPTGSNGTVLASSANTASVSNSADAYIGCYSWSVAGLNGMTLSVPKMSASMCRTSCAEVGYSLAVVTGTSCSCGNAWSGGQVLPKTSCGTACAGNSTEVCGGSSVASLYKTANAPAVATHPDGWVGCYSDTDDAALAAYSYTSNPMTPHACQVACAYAGYSIAGVEGTKCNCDNAIGPTSSKQPSVLCSSPCTGNANYTCGANYKMDVYNATGATASNGINGYLGCFSDTAALNGYYYASDLMSVDICSRACVSRGYRFAGLRAGSQCQCGNTAPTQVTTSTACVNPCSGNSKQNCGLTWTISTYDVSDVATGWDTTSDSTGLVGCFRQGSLRVLNTNIMNPSTLTNEMCATNCAAVGFAYSGTQAGNQCWCGSQLNVTAGYPVAIADCSTACSGGTGKCGGSGLLSVFDATKSAALTVASSPSVEIPEGYKGCYQASTFRTTTPLTYFSTSMTIELCRRSCALSGFSQAGLTNGNTCACTSDSSLYGGIAAPYLCSKACAGNTTEICGSVSYAQFSMYDSAGRGAAPPDGFPDNYVGCMTDSGTARKLSSYSVTSSGMTSALCLKYCKAQGYGVYGTEAGSQCWCGAKIPISGLQPDSSCSTGCAGIPTEKCGASGMISIYSTVVSSVPVIPSSGSSATPNATLSVSASKSASLASNATASAISATGGAALASNASSTTISATSKPVSSAASTQSAVSASKSSAVTSITAVLAPSSMAVVTSVISPVASTIIAGVPSSIAMVPVPSITAASVPTNPDAEPSTMSVGLPISTTDTSAVTSTASSVSAASGTTTRNAASSSGPSSMAASVTASSSAVPSVATVVLGVSITASATSPAISQASSAVMSSAKSATMITSTTASSSPAASSSTTANPDLVGCFTGTSSSTVITAANMTCTSLTPKMCQVWCQANDYAYAGMSGGNACACTNSISSLVAASAGTCKSPCIGDSTQMCGGADGYSVYKSTVTNTGRKRYHGKVRKSRFGAHGAIKQFA